MAQTGFTPISLYYTATAAAVPTAGNLVAGELAINTNDGKLFYKDSAGVVQTLATKGGVGSATNTQVLYNSSGLVVGSANLTFNGTTLTAGGLTTTGATSTGTFSATGVATFSAGSVSAPAITTTGDTNTGIYFPAADTIAFTEGGVEAMRIDSSGNIGVGTNNPFGKIASTANSYSPSSSAWATSAAFAATGAFGGGLSFLDGSAGYTMYVQDSGGSFGIGQGATSGGVATRLFINSSGNIGIGLTSPSVRLDVNGNIRVSGNNQLQIFNSAGTSGVSIQTDNASTTAMVFNTVATERMRIDSSGNVGIGTSSPTYKLDVTGTARVTEQADFANAINLTTSTLNYLYFNDALAFARNGVGERMRIDSSGNVGIGTSSPSNKLTVVGGVQLQTGTFPASGNGLELTFTAANTAFIQAYDRGTATWRDISTGGATLQYSTGGTERARIDLSGNLLVGLTTTRSGTSGMCFEPSNSFFQMRASGTASLTQVQFIRDSAGTPVSVGTINTTGSATAYNTSSDYRLKENIAPMTGALTTVAQLKPVTYKWKLDGSNGQGFIAHELQEVVPDCVTGEKDAINEDGSIKPQGIDTSFLIATLTAAIQEQQAMIETLTTRLNALEGK